MRGRRTPLAPLAVLAAAAALPAHLEAQDLDWESYARVRAHVLPAAEETAWLELGWRPTLWQGVCDGQAAKRPLVLWAMNGHPLGCT
jgi:hypothetical protein